MESKFKLNFFIRNAINSLFKTNKSFGTKNFNSYFKNLKKNLNKRNLIFLSSSALFYTFLKHSQNNILYSSSEDQKKQIPFEEKVTVMEYNANFPIEDRYKVVELKNIQGNLLAVFDGHGGEHTSDYVYQKIAPYLDSIYLKLSNDSKHKNKTQDQLITQALYETFQKIVKNFLIISNYHLFLLGRRTFKKSKRFI